MIMHALLIIQWREQYIEYSSLKVKVLDGKDKLVVDSNPTVRPSLKVLDERDKLVVHGVKSHNSQKSLEA